MTLGDLLDRERDAGTIEKVNKLILKHMRKNCSVSEIADAVDEPEEYVKKIYDLIIKIGIDTDTEIILEKVLQMQN